MRNHPNIEIITFETVKETDLFMDAVKISCKNARLENNSIKRRNEREVNIEPTRADLLIQIGIDFQKAKTLNNIA